MGGGAENHGERQKAENEQLGTERPQREDLSKDETQNSRERWNRAGCSCPRRSFCLEMSWLCLGEGEARRSTLPPSEGLKLPSAASLTRCPRRDQEGEPEDL